MFQNSKIVFDWLNSEFGVVEHRGGLSDLASLDADAFLKAVKVNLQKGRKLTAAEIAELRREYETTVEPARQIRAEISALEGRLSNLVNEAYGLAPDEVDLMWRTAPPRMPFTPAGIKSAASIDRADDEEE
jgi:hypothetical protein